MKCHVIVRDNLLGPWRQSKHRDFARDHDVDSGVPVQPKSKTGASAESVLCRLLGVPIKVEGLGRGPNRQKRRSRM